MNIFSRIRNRLSHAQIMALGFFMVIITGTILLMLPVSSRTGQWTPFIKALFTSVSSTCVTGLVVVDTFSYWTVFGQLVILVMIQIGGLGFISIGVIFALFFNRRIGLANRTLIQESVNSNVLKGIVRLMKNVILGTVVFECIGALLLSIRFVPRMGVARGIYNGIFHSITAFCNAGFDLMGRYEPYSSLSGYYDDYVVNITIIALILIGGLGFTVWADIKHNKLHFKKYTLHTKIVVVSSIILVVIPTIMFMVFERNGVEAGMPFKDRFITSFFASVTPRTAGYNTVDLGAMTQASKLLTIILMFIGGCPGSTAGGVKTTTIVVIIVYIWSNLRNSAGCNIYGRRLADEDIKKASMVIGLNLFMAVAALLIISGMQNFDFEDLCIEVFSAVGTVGLSTGITRQLNTCSQIVIILLMFGGRIGTVTFASSFAYNKKQVKLMNPEENINVG